MSEKGKVSMNNGKRFLSLWLCVLIVLSLSGCGIPFIQRRGINLVAPALPNMMDSAMKLKSGQLAKEGLPGVIILVSALAEMSPNNYTLLHTAAMAYMFQGLLVEDEDPEYASGLYSIAKDYGMRALKRNPKFRRASEEKGIGGLLKVIPDLSKRYVPAMCWTAMPWALYIFLNLDDPTIFIDLPLVLAMIDRVYELDKTYFFGVPHIVYMVYYAFMPTFMSGGPEKVEKEFKACLEVTDGEFLLPYVLYAEYYTVKYERKDLFEEALDVVLKAPPPKKTELNLVNDIAKMMARRLLEQKEELFPYY